MKSLQLLFSSLYLPAALALKVLIAPTAQAHWDFANDFTLASNPNGAWTYGNKAPGILTGSLFVYTDQVIMVGDLLYWQNNIMWNTPNVMKNNGTNTAYELEPGQASLHPGPHNETSTVRWTAPGLGTYTMKGQFDAGDEGAVDVHVYHNSTELFRAMETTQDQPFNLTQVMSAGDTMDFMVGNAGFFGSDTTPLVLTIELLTPPSIVNQPQSTSVIVGDTTVFAVLPIGSPSLSCQWRKDGSSLTNGVNIFGATGTNLTLFNVSSSHAGNYDVVVTNMAGGITSQVAVLTVLKASPVISWTNPAAISYGTSLSSIQLNATSSVPGTLTYLPPTGTVLNAGNGQVLSARFIPEDENNYNETNATVLINVLPAPLTVVATSATRAFGETNPVVVGTITGVLNGDPITAIYACAATPASAPGTYPIVPTLVDPIGRLDNYSVTISNGVLTVAASAPSVLSQAGLSPLSGKANLSGLVFSGGAPCLAWIEWGGSAAYGSNTAPKNLGAGYFPAPINESLAGMAPGSVVHFRVVSSNSAGITYGVDQTAYVTANSAPVLADILRQATSLDTPLPVALAVSDAETDAGSLLVTAWSGNTNVVPQANLVLSGGGTNRTLAINPAFGQWGRAVIVVIVDDGLTTTSKAFLLDVGLLPGDIDENGMVDLDDYFLLASRWYQRNNGP